MKKKCTASGCRKVFSYRQEERVICPHCGKEYPGLRKNDNRLLCNIDGFIMDLTFVKGKKALFMNSRINAVKMLRQEAGEVKLSLRTAVELVDYIRSTGKCPLTVHVKKAENGAAKVIKAARVW